VTGEDSAVPWFDGGAQAIGAGVEIGYRSVGFPASAQCFRMVVEMIAAAASNGAGLFPAR
jgi:hypothetical protein